MTLLSRAASYRSGGAFGSAWRHRALLSRLIARDVESRYRGSLFGKAWAVFLPLGMLGLYTLAFGVIIRPRWQETAHTGTEIALSYFMGLILLDFFLDCLGRAPSLMIEHGSYIKKVIFPVEILAFMVVAGALVRLAIGACLLIVFYLAVTGLPPLSSLAVPLLVVPLALFALGLTWLLSAVGLYVRDIRQAITIVAPIIMFLSPVFYRISSVDPRFASYLYINPLTYPIESANAALFRGEFPSLTSYVVYFVASAAFVVAASRLFGRLRPGFADVL